MKTTRQLVREHTSERRSSLLHHVVTGVLAGAEGEKGRKRKGPRGGDLYSIPIVLPGGCQRLLRGRGESSQNRKGKGFPQLSSVAISVYWEGMKCGGLKSDRQKTERGRGGGRHWSDRISGNDNSLGSYQI